MILDLNFNRLGNYPVELANTTEEAYQRIINHFIPLINDPNLKARDAIADALRFAITQCPNENPSDLWHHVLYRTYLDEKIGTSPEQSWVRASGEGFEQALVDIYNGRLLPLGYRLVPMFARNAKVQAMQRMGIANQVGSSKVDLIIEGHGKGETPDLEGWGIVGGTHVKVSLAERISDDIPASRIMMQAGLHSLLVTLDVKSFPPPHGDLINRGEFGTPANPSDKRQYIERSGDFTSVFSYNSRTVPSNLNTRSGRRIFVGRFNQLEDPFLAFFRDLP